MQGRSLASLGKGLVGFAVVVGCLELLARAGLVNPQLLPPMSTVLSELVWLPADADFMVQLSQTLQATLLGLALSFVVGTLAGVVLGSSGAIYRASIAFLEFLRPMPGVALIPVAILFFGVGHEMKLLLVLAAAVWPILFNTIYAVRGVDPTAVATARIFGYNHVQIMFRVMLPHALPFVYAGVRIAASIALLVVVSAELLTGADGLGSWLMVVGGEQVRTDLLFAGLIVAGLVGWGMNWGLVRGEHRLFGWKLMIHDQ